MALNQLIQLGQLNKLYASLNFQDIQGLNVTGPFLTKPGIKMAQEGNGVDHIPVMIGTVPSRNAFVMVMMTVHLVKTLPLAAAFQAQQQLDSFLGRAILRPDITPPGGLNSYQFFNVTIDNPREQSYAGDDASYPLVLRGYYPINSAMYS